MRTELEEHVTVEKMRPLDRRVIVRWAKRPEKTSGGIVLPEIARGVSQTGIVLKCAEDCRDVKEGDRILFSEYGSRPLIATEEDLVIVREHDIYAVVEP